MPHNLRQTPARELNGIGINAKFAIISNRKIWLLPDRFFPHFPQKGNFDAAIVSFFIQNRQNFPRKKAPFQA